MLNFKKKLLDIPITHDLLNTQITKQHAGQGVRIDFNRSMLTPWAE